MKFITYSTLTDELKASTDMTWAPSTLVCTGSWSPVVWSVLSFTLFKRLKIT